MDRLKNKSALITGGTSGIGLETAREFLREGARVAITAKDSTSLEVARKDLGRDVVTIASDMGDATGQKKLAETIREAFGKLDVLFLNAGIADMRPLEQWDESAFERSVDGSGEVGSGYRFISRASHALANSQSRITVRSEMPRTWATSGISSPPK